MRGQNNNFGNDNAGNNNFGNGNFGRDNSGNNNFGNGNFENGTFGNGNFGKANFGNGNSGNSNFGNNNFRNNKFRNNRFRNKRNRSNRGNHIGAVIFSILIVFLSLILVGQVFYILAELNDDYTSYHADEDDYMRHITYEEYFRLFDDTIEDCEHGREYTKTEQELRAVGYYYEAATLHKAYVTYGDTESAEKQKARMDRLREEAGSYASETEKIDELLGDGS